MIQCIICLIVLGAFSIGLYFSQQYLLTDEGNLIHVNVNSKDILFETDEEFLSVALDMSFMRRFFHEFSISDWEKLQQLSSLLSPAYLRLGGTDADRTVFNLNDGDIQHFRENNSYKSVPSEDSITITEIRWELLKALGEGSPLGVIKVAWQGGTAPDDWQTGGHDAPKSPRKGLRESVGGPLRPWSKTGCGGLKLIPPRTEHDRPAPDPEAHPRVPTGKAVPWPSGEGWLKGVKALFEARPVNPGTLASIAGDHFIGSLIASMTTRKVHEKINSHWNSTNAGALIKFSEKNGFSLSFQLGNEPNSFLHVFNKSLTGTQLAADYFELKKLLRSTKAYQKSKLIGPEVTRPKNLEGSSLRYLAEFLSNGKIVDVVSWHQYYLNGHTATLEDFINPETLDLLPPQINAISKVVREHSATTPIWISETSSAYGGGAPKLSDRFVASFLWLDKLGVSARMNMSVVIRQSLFKDHYSLISEDFTPTPDFWISVLYKNLVGNRVLSVKLAEDRVRSLLRIYGHCLASNSSLNGSVVLYGMNLSDQTQLLIPSGMNVFYPVYSYIFKPEFNNLKAKSVLMNDHPLVYSQTAVEDMLKMAQKVKFPLLFPAKSIGFWVFKETTESGCRR